MPSTTHKKPDSKETNPTAETAGPGLPVDPPEGMAAGAPWPLVRATLDRLSQAVAWLDPDGKVLYANRAAGGRFRPGHPPEGGRAEVVPVPVGGREYGCFVAGGQSAAPGGEEAAGLCPDPMVWISPKGEILYQNPAALRLWEAAGLGSGPPPELTRALGDPAGGEVILDLDGGRFAFRAVPVPGGRGVLFHGRDAAESLELKSHRLMASQIFENSIEGIILADREGRVLMVNSAFSHITGYPAREVLGRELNVLRADSQDPEFYENLWEALLSRGSWHGEYWNRRRNGESYPEWLSLSVIRDPAGNITNYIAMFHDLSEIRYSQERIRYLALHDALTDLPNREYFKERLAQAMERARRGRHSLAVLYIDLDDFKRINDSLGHQEGDALLKVAAGRLAAATREEDTLARLGADEFGLLLEGGPDHPQAVLVAGRVREALKEPVRLGDNELAITASLGIAHFPGDGEDPGELLKNADLAMFRAKEDGGDGHHVFTPVLHDRAARRIRLESSIRRALEREEFVVHFQPKVDLKTGRMTATEALVRWNRPGKGVVGPDRFIGPAEDSGLIVPLGLWVLRRACLATREMDGKNRSDLGVAVNISPRQFRQKDLVAQVERVITETGLDPSRLELEITESTIMRDVDRAIRTLMQLAEMGVSLSVDDFGTGYSSLYYLKHFPINTLKVDRSFVRDIGRDPNDAAIVETIINMAHTLKLKVVAEGVEDAGQLEFLRARSCDEMQGWLVSPAVPPEGLNPFLEGDLLAPHGPRI